MPLVLGNKKSSPPGELSFDRDTLLIPTLGVAQNALTQTLTSGYNLCGLLGEGI